jgi:GT2 family glycosyltransferase
LSADVGIVVIGRNEGARLVKCLESVAGSGCPVVYVDSGSSDDSVAVAGSFGVRVHQLDSSRPVSAARARNEGFDQLLAACPQVRFVQFIDGDCTLLPGWIEAGSRALSENAARSAVIGHLLERNADASIYNRLCALEWRLVPGDLQNYGVLGGIAMMRTEVFRRLGGFRPEVIAGEDSELAVRMQLAGFVITKIDFPMATHDANMRCFLQWWRRSVRAGHAIGQRAALHGRSRVRDCVRERRSTLFWGLGLPLVIAAAALPSGGASAWLLAAYPALVLRVWRGRLRMGHSPGEALLYAAFVVVGKFANAFGLLKYFANRRAGRYEIIEYK